MASLKDYERKRKRGETPEPFEGGQAGKAPIFVVQRHDARRLHYDFRLERDGALASWAVPKGVPLEPGQQNLAVHVEDHPLTYATFEGEIPAGNYGAGTVEIWDHGTYELVEEKKNGGLTVRLHGERLDGTWALVPAKLSGDPKNWLIVRKREEAAEQPRAPARPRAAYAPMLATLSESVPRGEGWLHEVKWDGYRAIITVAGSEVTLTSRRGNSLTERFASVAKAVEQAVRTPDCVLDGEVCALDEQGRASFSAMQQGSGPLVVYLFDVLEIDGQPVIELPLTERRERLAELVDWRNRTVRLSEVFDDGEALLAAARSRSSRGSSARSRLALPTGQRSREWLKVKTTGRQELVIAGWTKGHGPAGGQLRRARARRQRGRGASLGGQRRHRLRRRRDRAAARALRPLLRKTSPLAEVPKMPRVRKDDVCWVEPELVAEVRFAEWTHDGRLRSPVYEGLREDKEAEDGATRAGGDRERDPQGQPRAQALQPRQAVLAGGGDHQGRPARVLPRRRAGLVPHLRDRPFTMKRYPDGWNGKFFFQKDAPKHMPDWIPTRPFEASTRDKPPQRRVIDFPLVNDELALLWMVNMGCIDMNTWYSRVDKPSRPDFVLFDLDPSPDVGFPETIRVALLIKETLDLLELESFAKTSGSEGIHILVPIARRHTYAQTREFSEIVAGALARAHPGLATTDGRRRSAAAS